MKFNFINKIIFGVFLIVCGIGIGYSFNKVHLEKKQTQKVEKILPAKFAVTEEMTDVAPLESKSMITRKRERPIYTFQTLKALAQAGDSSAQSELGAKYFNADGVPKDYKQAYYWLLKAAQQSDVNAQLVLSNMYLYGQGVQEDEEQGKMWLLKSAKQGNSNAQYTLAEIYYEEDDFNLAKNWFEKSAVQEDKLAQTKLGEMFFKGQGTSQDYLQAYKWLSLAADRGYKRAIKKRTEIEREMSVAQIEEGKKIVEKWKKEHKDYQDIIWKSNY